MILEATILGEGPPVALLHGLLGQARNFGAIQRRLAAQHRVIALDLRNHGASPHAPGMSYPEMAADVRQSLAARDALPAAIIGHSMGGKVAMALALTAPDAVSRLMVADIAPVPNPPRFGPMIAAMRALPLHDGMTRAAADAALSEVVPDPGMRAFVLQNLTFGGMPAWKPDLTAIAEGLPDILGWPDFGTTYDGPTLFLGGARSDYILPEHRPLIRALFPRARIATLKDAGHWLHADNPEGFLAVVESFLG
jgi:pimeloyl-ACP methyl ester carboxylesterase